MNGRLPGFVYDARRKRARFEITVPGTNGLVRHRKTLKTGTRAKALEEWKKFHDRVLSGCSSEVVTLGQFVERYADLSARRLCPSTARSEQDMLARMVLPDLGSVPLEKINATRLRDLLAALKGQGYAPTTINRALRVVRKYLKEAVERELIPAYPVRGRLPQEAETPLRLELSEEERRRFFDAFADERGFRDLIVRTRSGGRVI